MGQFMTPASIARRMASYFSITGNPLRLLDPGAGVGSLSAAFVDALVGSSKRPASLHLTAYELDPDLEDPLRATLDECDALCRRNGVGFEADVRIGDFIEQGSAMLGGDLFGQRRRETFDCVIVNPPYRKIGSDSTERRLLRAVGVETTNLYAGFLAIAVKLLENGGQLVAITPRSFCNGPYFKSFRHLLLDNLSLRRIHLFETRDRAFEDDRVLQENVIFHGVRGAAPAVVTITANESAEDRFESRIELAYDELVQPDDPDRFIRLVTDELGRLVARRMRSLRGRLDNLSMSVSTGPVVDFRARNFLRDTPVAKSAALVYPTHLDRGLVKWPKMGGKKPNAIAIAAETTGLLLPAENYVLTKRFSSKEERRRLVPALFQSTSVTGSRVGFENHLNFFHRNGGGLPLKLAKGLTIYLSSTLVDTFFRQFNGHTQVNASDLRSLRYPTRAQLEALGARVGRKIPEQSEIDRLIEDELFSTTRERDSMNPVEAKKKVEEALSILKDLELPKGQQNERTALTLLALLDLRSGDAWTAASSPLRGITQMMDFFAEAYGKRYAPNTRETIRKHSVHQLVEAGLVAKNPDRSSRPTNSPNTVYQFTSIALELLQSFGSKAWTGKLQAYLRSAQTLSRQYARERRTKRLPVRVAPGEVVKLSPGPHSSLIKKVLDDFGAIFVPGATVVYVGDTERKWAYFDQRLLSRLGAQVDEHGKMPDIVLYDESRSWLVLVEAVSTHGPIDAKRHTELRRLFVGSKPGLVFVTAFPNRQTLSKYLQQITWESEVWIADSPSHLIHFDGERFLGPFDDDQED